MISYPTLQELESFYSRNKMEIENDSSLKQEFMSKCDFRYTFDDYIFGLGYSEPYVKYLNGENQIFINVIPPDYCGNHHIATTIISDICSLPIRNESVTRIIVANILEYTEHQFELFAELSRILCPGGKLLIAEPELLSRLLSSEVIIGKASYYTLLSSIAAKTHNFEKITSYKTTFSSEQTKHRYKVALFKKGGFVTLKIGHGETINFQNSYPFFNTLDV